MTRLSWKRPYDAPADVVWAVVTDPDVYADVAPNLSVVEVLSDEGEGMVRRCVDTGGNEWTETCHYWEPGRGFGVTVDVPNSEFHRRLFTRFSGRWELEERADDVLVTVSFEFDARYGPLGRLISWYFERRAPSLVERIFDGWEAEIERRLEPVEQEGRTIDQD